MGRQYDIAQRIANANQKPTIVVDADHEFTINNGKSVVIIIMSLADKMEKKPMEESIKDMDKIISLALGEQAFEYIQSLDLTFPAYQLLVESVIVAFNDGELEDVEEPKEGAKKK